MTRKPGAKASKAVENIGIPQLFGYLLRAIVWGAVVLTPLMGVWLASSLAAYANRPTWLVALAGLLLFPILPFAWELRARAKAGVKRVLTLADRLLLRTLAINLPFLGLLLAFAPQAAIRAVSARGDWMLDGRESELAKRARNQLHNAADGMQFIHAWAQEKPDYDDPSKRKPTPQPVHTDDTINVQADGTLKKMDTNEAPTPKPAPAPVTLEPGKLWPSEQSPHPRALAIPSSEEVSIESVAAYFLAQEPSQTLRFRLLHDWVADRIAYDANSLADGSYVGKQAVKDVFAARMGVCAGYARVLEALGKAAGLDVRYVLGWVKVKSSDVDGARHAWNIATLDGKAYLADATWNSGFIRNGNFSKEYRSDYVFTTPEAFGFDHFPEDEKDQLREIPISRGDFMRQPNLRPTFVARGWTLDQPTRSQVTVERTVDAQLTSTLKRFLLVDMETQDGTKALCIVTPSSAQTHVHCTAPGPGSYTMRFFDGPKQYGSSYEYIGNISVLAR
jgi:Transglutaminase-like superfamily